MTRNCGNCFANRQPAFCIISEITCCIYWTGGEPKAKAPVIPTVNYQIVRQALEQMSNFPPDCDWVSAFVKICAAIRGELES